MISMQRSLSSPVCIQSSPPVSPTVPPQRSSRPPTPTTEQNVQRPRGYTSRSPTRAPETTIHSTMQSRRSEDGGGRSISQRPPSPNTSRKPIAAQPTVPRNDAPQPSPSKPVITQGPSASASQQQSQVGDDNTNSNNNKTAAPQPQPESPQAPPVPIETKPPAKSIGKPIIMPQPLITDDISLYTNPNLEVEAEGTTLEELAHLVRLSKYQERKRASTRIRLQRTLISTALFARLTRCGEAVHHHLYEAFRSQDKQSFAGLYNAFIDVRNSCEATRRYALLEPEMEALTSSSSDTLDATPIGGAIGGSSVTPFLNDISASAREAFLGFLTSLRTNPDYLATRLCSLSSAELATFVNFNQAAEPESVLPGGGATPRGGRTGSLRRSGNPLNSSNRNSTHMPSPVEKLLSFQRHDPLATLLHSCFANSAGPESVEDRRRTDVWATAIARLVTSANHNGMNPNSSPDHQIMASTLSAWASMRDWTGRSKMEWYLMKVLEEGAFILQRAEDPNGTMFMVSTWTTEDQRKQDEFYNRAVEELFEILDDEDATGIPEGAVELGQQILRKLDGRFMDHTRQWFVYQWLFADWLFRVMASPESFGMMVNYNITPYGRDKILKTIHGKAQSLVTNMLPTWEKGHATAPKDSPPHKIVGHIESILSRFKPSRSRKLTTRLLPARSVTSLRETTEVRPYLIISPADLATMVNALFPEPRPRSSHSSSIRSGAPSVSSFSAISQPMSVITNRSQFDTQSIVSTSYSSTMSDTTTSQETIDEQLFQRHSPDSINQNRMSNYEDDGYRLRFALHEMNQILGSDVVRGSCHPCAERWAVIFLSPDGRSLSTQMSFDPDDEADDEENSSTTSDSDGELEERPELDKDYHQLRDSILKLVEEYEIPQGLDKDANKFSNRPSGLKKYKSKNKIITPESSMQSKNPYRQMAKVEEDEEPPNVLIAMLQAASSQSKAQSEFVSAHLYWKTLQQLSALTSPSLRKDGFATLLNIFSRGPRDSIRRSAAAIEEYDAWLVWLKQSQERHEGLIESMMGRLRGLRDMTWYVTDVRHSKPYAESMSVCKALRTMGNPRLWDNFRRTRVTNDRGVSARYLLSTNNQVIDMIAAPEDQGGPNKLTDEHAEIAFKWLQHQEIENFCRGEERIHRLCYEVDSCISKLLGSTVLDGPVLWSSELFAKDKKMLENAGKDKGVSWTGSSLADDTSSIISDSFERRNTFSTSSRPSSLAGNLRNMSLSNTSQQSFESGRFSFPRAAPTVALSEATDSHEYFGVGSPVRTIDSASTFFSPFQSHSGQSVTASRAHSPTTSITNLSNTLNNAYSPAPLSSGRPGTSASSNETVSVQKNSEEKQRFLDDLRQSLTSLLISDLGSLVFALGSETDAWFGKLGQEMIDRKETQSKYRRRLAAKKEKAKDKVAKSMMKPRVIEKKKSIGDLRGAHDEIGSEASDNTATLGHDSSATSDTMRSARSRKRDSPEFPFVKAYQRLLSMFCVHPNPHAKLQALFDLEHLIVASLASGSKRSRLALGRADLANSTINENEATGRQKPLEDAIDNVRERRSQTFLSPLSSPVMPGQPRTINTETRSVMSVIGPTNTDAIANVLQSLFRDANIRPKTLFRDLQYIASFVPPSILDKTEKGKAFWDTALAALALKQEVCCSMVEVADEVNKGHLEVRKNTRPGAGSAAGSDAGSSASGYMGIDTTSAALPSPSLPKYTARNAAEMLTIAAKERNATAQRELAFSYLMQAELLDRATLPLSRPRDVFKQALIEQYGPARQHHGPRGEGGMIDVKQDPALICLAFHWAGQADSGGDELAGQFIRQHLEADKSSKM